MTSPLIAQPLLRFAGPALLALCNLASAAEPGAAAASAPPSISLMAPVTALIGEAPCDAQEQCHVIGIGAKACGGPGGYLAWSDKKTDANALQLAVAAQTQAQREENKASGLVSDCRVMPEPLAVCRPRASDNRKTCQLGQGGASSAV